MPQGSFSAQVSADVAAAKGMMDAVFRESVQRTIEIAQTPIAQGGNMPVKTGFLRASGAAVIGAGNLPALVSGPATAGEGQFTWDGGAVALTISTARLGDTITFAYAANYAVHQEYGSNGREGRRFVGLAAQRWPQTVEQVSREAQARAG